MELSQSGLDGSHNCDANRILCRCAHAKNAISAPDRRTFPDHGSSVARVVHREVNAIDGLTAAQVEALRQMLPQDRLEALRNIENALASPSCPCRRSISGTPSTSLSTNLLSSSWTTGRERRERISSMPVIAGRSASSSIVTSRFGFLRHSSWCSMGESFIAYSDHDGKSAFHLQAAVIDAAYHFAFVPKIGHLGLHRQLQFEV